MLSTYRTQADFLGAVSSLLDADGAPRDLRSALVSGIASADDGLRRARASDSLALDLKVGAWVIRDDDVPIIQALNAIGAAVAASLATSGVALPSVALAVTGLADLCWRAWRRGARLSELQLAVYGFLAAQGPMKVDALAACLANDDRAVAPDVLEGTLRGLTEFDLSDGNVVALVAREHDGAWKALRV